MNKADANDMAAMIQHLTDRAVRAHNADVEPYAKISGDRYLGVTVERGAICLLYGDYDECYLKEVPQESLLLSDADFEAWEAGKLAARERVQKEREARSKEDADKKERELFERLKAKFGN